MKAMALASCVLALLLLAVFPPPAQSGDWRSSFPVDKRDMGVPVDNPYFVLDPTKQLHLQHGTSELTRTVLNVTKAVDGVTAVVVEDRIENGGKLLEVDREYYSMDKTMQDVYCFGRDVNNYESGKDVSHKGSWSSGANGASFGLVMPGEPKSGDRFYEVLGPNKGMERAEIAATNDKIKIPAGTYKHCVHIKEIGLKGKASHKWYAPGIGLVKFNDLVLVKIQKIEIQPVDLDDK